MQELVKSQNLIACSDFLSQVLNVQEVLEIDDQFQLPEEKQNTSLKNSNVTRWNSILIMVRSFIVNYQTIHGISSVESIRF